MNRCKNGRGFTLLEMSIVLIIMGAMLGGGISTFLAYVKKEGYQNTERRLQRIEEELVKYRKAFNRLPCPADITRAVDTSEYGREALIKGSCTGGVIAANLSSGNMVSGMVPTKTLGLPDDYAFDSWGRRIRYAVDKRYTEWEGFSTYGASHPMRFVEVDASTQGNWKNKYGKDGYSIAGQPIYNPTYATLTASGGSGFQVYSWASSSTDVRALEKVLSTDRLAACWAAFGNVTFEININDGKPHYVAFYLVDWDAYGPRSGSVELRSADGSITYDTRIVDDYQNGKYYIALINKTAKFIFDYATGNTVVSGVFFDPFQREVFSLLSHGANGHGGYPRDGGSTMFNAGSNNARELTNCACDNTATAGTFSGTFEVGAPTENLADVTDSFDDIGLKRDLASLSQ